MPLPQAYAPEGSPNIDLVKVPRLRHNLLPDLSLPGEGDKFHHLTGNESEEAQSDLSEGECEAQMRKLRRSLSIERRFDKAAEEERPRLVRHSEGNQDDSVDFEREKARLMEGRQGWSFTAAADAWDG